MFSVSVHMSAIHILTATTTTTTNDNDTTTTTTTTAAAAAAAAATTTTTTTNRAERRNFEILCNLLTAPRTVSNTHAQVALAQSCANHVQHIERLSRATCSVRLGTKGKLSY